MIRVTWYIVEPSVQYGFKMKAGQLFEIYEFEEWTKWIKRTFVHQMQKRAKTMRYEVTREV